MNEATLHIYRFFIHKSGTFSELILDVPGLAEIRVGFGVEQPWADNTPFISCIPAGEYDLVPFTRPNGNEVVAFVGGTVSLYKDPNFKRYTCLIHIANWPQNVEGCLGPGDDFVCQSIEHTEPMVTNSRPTMERLMRLIRKHNVSKAVIHWPTFE